jgi:nucleoside-diphosphate-sugar epimerase
MKNLILGSEGQVGLSLKEHLHELGEEVFEMDILRDSKEDLRIPQNSLLDEYLSEADFVFFLAFDVGGSKYLSKYQNTPQFILNNMKIMSEVFSSLEKHRKKFMFASSQMSNMTYSNYGILKLIGEKTTTSLQGLNTQFWNVYGVEKDEDKSHVITDFIKMARTGKIMMRTDGQEERQFLHSDDCSRCLVAVRDNYEKFSPHEPLQITSFEWTKIVDVAKTIQAIIPCEIVPSEVSDDVQLNKRNEPSREILNHWNPKISLEEGLRKVMTQI